MKNILIISFGEHTGLSIKNQLKYILKDKVNINNLILNSSCDYKLDGDLVIFSSQEVKDICLPKIDKNLDYVILKRVIRHECIDEILKIRKYEDILVVNDTKESCDEVINQLNNQGIDHVNYYSYYPGIINYKNASIAITPGEPHLVPNGIKRVIDIKPRRMDVISLIEILMKLNYMKEYESLISSYFYKDIIDISKKYISMYQESNKVKEVLTSIVDNQRNGIIYTDTEDNVITLNEEAVKLLNTSKENIIGENIYKHFKDLKEDIISISDKEVLISKENIRNNDIYSGNMIVLNEVKHIHKIDDELRRKEKSKDSYSKYTFDDIVGSCKSLIKNINLAKKIAKTNSTVLIQGETGTGKEVLAQAIHNESERRDYPFVAINFAAIPENLIESELFGYEEGAFTGAKKGGKVGLFKKAHKGTIFLDEIGDASLYLQSRLLRVLQEREITPVGSTEAIPIDIRVIAATNRELFEEVKLKNFREDLYYRLNVMPVYSIPLRNRKEDIKLLLEYYLFKFVKIDNLELFFTNDAIKLLEEYHWPGNIRELVNIVEYVCTIKDIDSKVEVNDFPKYIIESVKYEKEDSLSNQSLIKEDLDEKELWVLKKIYKYEGIGRRTLSIVSYEEGYGIGEGKVRSIMKKLRNDGYIDINKGLKGTKISEKGIKRVKS
ncbi:MULTISPECIES: sigma-54 interaction domain-containing protein [unclassified Romboutsia]|uniref:sigma-54 interaction domain-containing protein n=1 Tax=unclassified Romboutsia TaxID=2626894 RepID=UPI0008215588|nr:sigma 54-interacting transcriptional regulator [Romboutsia sp. Marseille-P6047]SCH15903.1 (S)-limonene 6-monooxygenase [uncultured Clostridium sp.]